VPELALIVNPTKVEDQSELVAELSRRCSERGWQPPLVLQTTAEDPGAGMVAEALRHGACRIAVLGGDGTVAACAAALAEQRPEDGAGTARAGASLALLPGGTGNLLARNLGIPVELPAALDVAFADVTRKIDVLRTGGRGFVVMAGLGFDATMMEQTSELWKDRIGWPAYVGGLIRSLSRAQRARVTIRVDDHEPVSRRAIGVLVANVGTLQAGVVLFPAARPDDGLLDVLVLAPHRIGGWLGLAWHILRGDAAGSRHAHLAGGGRVRIEVEGSFPLEFDGDVADPVSSLDVQVLPGALTVCVPDPSPGG
jgi:diacylglycerol kinase family enzyme